MQQLFVSVHLIIGGHQHRPWYRRYPTSDIDISYSDIGTKDVGLNPFIPISGPISTSTSIPISDIPISKIFQSFPTDPSNLIWHIISTLDSNSRPSWWGSGNLPLRYEDIQSLESDIGYQTKFYSDIRYNVGLCTIQSHIGSSDIRLSPIRLITDIGLSAHLCILFAFLLWFCPMKW